uniref:protein-tyrosine-phosphatase n=1 Tax=Stegastes partitus TaxID=144197 RepID=A0A3B4ZYI9_9TELE
SLSGLGMDPVILLGGFSAFHALYPFLCTPRMVLVEPERQTLTIYPSEILEEALYQGSASQASDYRIIKNLHITHVVNATPAGRVLVHCSMGRSRSSALTLAFLMEHRQWSLLHALRWLKERRACTAPNVNFLRQLLTYEDGRGVFMVF